jgi:soluble lytic murein transglycosylase-like protein
MRGNAILATMAIMASSPAIACWAETGNKYGINPYLLYAIAKTESGLNPSAVNRNRNGSYDVGLMQINSSWFPTLLKYGITEKQLYDPCVSIEVGAWILAQNMRHHGNSWNAVGAYNSNNPTRSRQYAMKIYNNLPPPLLAR